MTPNDIQNNLESESNKELELLNELSNANSPLEKKKRKREFVLVLLLIFLFLLLTWIEFKLFGVSQELPFVHSIFFFGLVNFNIVLLLLLLFLIFRNVVKVFVERKGKLIGSSLKGKLIAAFVAFSFVPTVLMFLISVFYINSSFDKWFSVKMAGVLKSSLEVTNAYYFNAKKRNYHFAHEIASSVRSQTDERAIEKKISQARTLFSLDAVEYYPSLFGKRVLVISDDETLPIIPPATLEFLEKGIKSQVEASTIHQFGEGNLVRVIVPISEHSQKGAIVVSSFVPLSLISKMNDISSAYSDFRDLNPLEYPLKSIYLVILFLMTLVILLCATWFGFHLAKQLSIPLVLLGRATKRVTSGDYRPVEIHSGSEEISQLVDSFNQMTSDLEDSEIEVKEANQSLKETLSYLDKHSRYVEVVLRNVGTGVISVDKGGLITTLNRRAGQLLSVEPEKYVGRPVRDLLTVEYFRTFAELLRTMQEHNVESLQKEIRINVQGQALPIQMTLSILKDEKGQDVGKILVFDDLTPLVNAQRAAAWTEVARRIAHEIKNPLTPIKLSAERLQRKFGAHIQDEAFKECTGMIIKQADDLRNLVNEFSQFARLPQTHPVLGSLNKTMEEALIMFRQAHAHIPIVFSGDASLPEFRFDPDQIKRVVTNLVDNSVAAIPSHQPGEVKLSTQYDNQLKIVKIVVADNGSGIPAHDRVRIFEPYFSTKQGGTGLGLAIVKRIVEDHNGFIRALANEPKGAKFLIELPVVELSQSLRTNEPPPSEEV
ncbi:MAG: ATP-binding protein [Pseudobdellovibrionaceae bacterium]